MKPTLTLLLGFGLFWSSSISAMAEAITVSSDQGPHVTIVQQRDCKGDKDDNCK
ncbi:MAG: hypothetical protein N5P05_002131 [Chroococcopsis gigantea SAG 12.99]|nr:hypothetical protein [Chlorogloea purpurea SAG 13.99]MDV3000525.1 hypothetical protein [Chroococcopsis gigantea SAG 12.99]